MASWQAALRPVPGGCVVLVQATPGAREDRFPDGFDAWRGRLRVRVTAPAVDNAANRAIAAVVAARLGVGASEVRIVEGATGSRKGVFVPLDAALVLQRLEGGQ